MAEEKKQAEKMVKIKLFKDNERYKDDVFVAVNGRSFQIKRGEEVEVPEYVSEVLEQSARQDEDTAKLMDQESSSFRVQAEKMGI